MFWLITVLIGAALLRYRHYWPKRGLAYITCDELIALRDGVPLLKMIDVRDSAEYMQGHVHDSISISVGRLPYVWQQELSADDSVVLIGSNRRKIQQAARMLKRKAGIQVHKAWLMSKRDQQVNWNNGNCTCLK